MRVFVWNDSGWFDYIDNAVTIRRLSRTKWEIVYYIEQSEWCNHSQVVIMVCDHIWIEAR